MGRTSSLSIQELTLEQHSAGSIFDRLGVRVALWAAVSVVFTLLVLQYSFVRGRLLLPAGYDDVTYLLDGLGRVEIWYGDGLWGMMLNWLHYPPHSPFSTVLAMAGFGVFGMHDWGAYVWNAGIVFTLLMFCDWLLGPLGMRWKILAAIVALSTPITGQSVAEFRPDMMAGLLAAMLVVTLLCGKLIGGSPRRLLAAGVIWGACLWTKPSVFPVTLGLGGMALVLATARDCWLAERGRIRRVDIAAAWMLVLIPAMILPLPHFLADGRTIVRYIWNNEVGGQRQMWQLHADLRTHLLYYSLGQGGQAMLGQDFWILLFAIILGVLLQISGRTDGRTWATIGCGIIVTAAAYVVPTINPQKQPFLATPFDFLLLFGAILAIRQLTREHLSPLVGLAGGLMMFLLAVTTALCSGFPGAPGLDRGSADVRTTRQTITGVYAIIRDHYAAGEKRVWLNLTGPLNTDLLRYTAMKDGLALTFTGNASATDLAIYRKGYDTSDYVVAADPGVPDLPTNLASNAMLDQTLALIRSRDDFELLATVPIGDGLNYYVFRKIGQFHGWSKITGLGPLEGPYPQWGIGQIRWGLGPATTITLSADSPRDAVLSMQVQSQTAGQNLTVLLDGHPIAEHPFGLTGSFDAVTVPLHLGTGGHTLLLKYAKWAHDPSFPAAVPFESLKVEAK